MIGMRKTYDAAFKAKVAFKAAKGEKTITQIASEFSIHPNQIRQWRTQLLEQLPEMFSHRKSQQAKAQDELVAELFRQIGQLKVELDWLKMSRRSSCREEENARGTGASQRADCPTMQASGFGPGFFLLRTRGRNGIEPDAHADD